MKSIVLDFFKENIDLIEGCDGGGLDFSLPKFELRPTDFLRFAEEDLSEDLDMNKLINITSNLKRAMDCELDTLMCVLGLDEYYRTKRLGVDKKLGFLQRSGIFKAQSLERLNKYRNRLEHHYEVPSVEDVQVYFDLISAFVSIGDSFIYRLRSLGGNVSLMYIDSNFQNAVLSTICLNRPKIQLGLTGGLIEHKFSADLQKDCSIEEMKKFSYLLKVNQLIGDFYYDNLTEREFIAALSEEI